METIKNKYEYFTTKYKMLAKFFDGLFLALLSSYVFGCVIQTTTFKEYFGFTIMNAAAGLMFWIALIRIFFWLRNWKEFVFACALVVCIYVIYCFHANSLLYFLGIMTIGTFQMKLEKVLKVHVITVGSVVFVAIFASLTGTVNHLVYIWDAGKLRDSFGICYPTDFASYLFFLLLLFWITWEKIPGWVTMMICIPFLMIVKGYALSDTCTICGAVFLLILLIIPVFERFFVIEGKWPKIKKMVDVLLVSIFPLLSILMFGLIVLYSWETKTGNAMLGVKMNNWISGRLRLALNVFENKGVHLFGSKLTQLGNGNTTFPVMGYDFVDSSYPLILLRDGWIIFLLICVLWIFMTYRAVRAKNYRLAFGMGLIALHSFIEHHFTEVHYNILLFLPFAVIPKQFSNEAKEEMQEKKWISIRWKEGVCLLVTLLTVVLFLPFFLATMRTICGAMRLNESAGEIPFVIASALALILFIGSFAYSATILWDGLIRKVRNRKAVLFFGVACLVLLSMIGGGIFLTTQARDIAKNVIQQDQDILAELDQVAEGKIYSTDFPLFYSKGMKHFQYSILTGEDLARKQNATIIVPRGIEYYVFLRKGFCYAAISETTSVYSNDPNVIEKLQELGKSPKSYFDEIRYVEIPTNVAPATNLRMGRYTVKYLLHVTVGESEPENIAHLLIVGNRGYTVIADHMLSKEVMDENGDVEYALPIELSDDTAGIMFYIVKIDDCQVEVKEVSYQMTPW